jgi:hypothetical protein
MKLTVLVLLLPLMTFLCGVFLLPRDAGNAVVATFLVWWLLTAVVCFGRGCFIFRRHGGLAWCCFGVVFLQVVLAILPVLGDHSFRHSV